MFSEFKNRCGLESYTMVSRPVKYELANLFIQGLLHTHVNYYLPFLKDVIPLISTDFRRQNLTSIEVNF